MDDFAEILQLPKRALWDRIDQELQENPVLDCEVSSAAVHAAVDPLAILELPMQVLRDRVAEESSDLIVDRSPAGEPEVRMPDNHRAHLIINPRCSEMVQDTATDPATKQYLGKMIKKAERLLAALERRRVTLKQLGMTIFQQQRAFLEHGPDHIVPLSADQIAGAIGTPTVREAVKNKQVRTPHGVLALHRFIARRPMLPDH